MSMPSVACPPGHEPGASATAVDRPDRRTLAAARLTRARAALAACDLCPRRCGANRLAGERGFCGAVARPRVHLAQVEVGDELELIPTFAVALSGCNLRCVFCITGAQSWNPDAGTVVEPAALAGQAEAALAGGARTITILGGEPTIHVPFLLELVAAMPPQATLVLKTNGYGRAAGRRLLDGLFDVWCVDYKFGNDACAWRLAGVPDYTAEVRASLRHAARHAQLIVRHLLMPGHVDCCWRPVAAWLGAHLPDAKVSLKTGFWPGWQVPHCPELRQPLTPNEVARAHALAAKSALKLVA